MKRERPEQGSTAEDGRRVGMQGESFPEALKVTLELKMGREVLEVRREDGELRTELTQSPEVQEARLEINLECNVRRRNTQTYGPTRRRSSRARGSTTWRSGGIARAASRAHPRSKRKRPMYHYIYHSAVGAQCVYRQRGYMTIIVHMRRNPQN